MTAAPARRLEPTERGDRFGEPRGSNAWSVIGDRNDRLARAAHEADLCRPGVTQGIVDQIAQRLAQPFLIADERDFGV